ncbi:MAG: CvpA family protein [Erysipelothrix sp.]|nr:CvpA family protein [Erysipelothrix sp.]
MFSFPYEFIIYLNAVLVLFLVFVIYRGYKKGMLLQLVGLISTFVSMIIAWIFSDVFMNVFHFVTYNTTGIFSLDNFVTENANRLIWFVILFLVIRLLMMVLTPIASLISKLPLIKQVNSAFGAVFSLITYLIYIVLIVLFLSTPIIKNGNQIIENTFLRTVDKHVISNLGFLEDKLEENEALQSLMSNRGLSVTQKQAMVDMLSEQGFSNAEIKEFLQKND